MPSADFEKATLEIEKIDGTLADNDKLKLYALYKIAHGEEPKKPGMLDFVGKAKYKEWEKVKDDYATPADGEKAYIAAVEEFKTKHGFDAKRTEMSDGTKIDDKKLKRYAELTA